VKPVECSEVEDLIIFGSNKLEMELEAARNVGIENVRYDLLAGANASSPDEILAEHHDHLNLY
jgi:hypothetical protein